MWEGENSWNKSISLVDGKSDSYQLIISPCSDPISPLSSVGNGSPYSGGSMSPDTTSISSGSGEGGSIWGGSENGDCFSPADLFTTTGFFFGNGLASPSPDWCSSPGGALPSLHEWRKADLQRKYLHQQQQQLIQRFVFPDVTTPPSDGGRDDKLYNSSIGGDPVVTSSTPPSKDSPLNREITDNSGSVVPTSSKVVPPLTIGQRAVRFMKSFRSSTSSSSTCSTNKALSSEVISSTSLAEVNRHFDCMWIDCRGSFLQKDSLIEHIDRTHIQTRKEDFSCFWHGCVRRNRAFNARYKLLIHMRVHTGHKPNKCTVFGCDKAFSRLENLKIHLRSHTGERPYICPHCPKAFSNSSDRAKHQRTHFDSKPYACTYQDCVKRYTDPSSLRKHAKMHYLTGAGGVKASGKTVVGTSCKKDGQVKRNRRKYLGGGEGSDCKASVAASLPLPLSPAASLLPPIFEPKPEAQKCNAVSTFLNGNGDPQLNHFVSPPTSYFSTAEGPILCSPGIPLSPLIIKTEIESKESNAVGQTASNSDLDQIPLNDLDWISGVNFDDDFYFDYDL